MGQQGEIDIASTYFNEISAHKLFDFEAEQRSFQRLERAAARVMELIESEPELRALVSEVPRSLFGNAKAIIDRFHGGEPQSRDFCVTALKRAEALLADVQRHEDTLTAAQTQEDRDQALKLKYFGLLDNFYGAKLMKEALEHPLARQKGMGPLRDRINIERNKIVQANLRLVTHLAKRYVRTTLTLLDLVQEGSIGLMRAVDKFEWRRGFKFSTYAVWWIKQSILRAIDEKSSDVRMSTHKRDLLRRVGREVGAFELVNGRRPEFEEIAALDGTTRESYEMTVIAARKSVSLDVPMPGYDEDMTLAGAIEDEDSPNPHEECEKNDIAKIIRSALVKLHPREEEILALRYGLRDCNPLTLEEISEVFDLTRERIRQIETQALQKLTRGPARAVLDSLL